MATLIPRDGYRERQVMAYVQAEIANGRATPSYGMIARELHMSERYHVCRVVKRLEAKGKLARVGEGRTRRIRMV